MTAPVHVDFIIVGLGIAGATLAYRLRNAGQKICVIDRGAEMTSSRIAAGLINPVTGRNYVKSWMIEKLLEEANGFYRAIEQHLGVSVAKQMDILRVLKSDREVERWMMRTGDPAYKRFMGEVSAGDHIRGIFREKVKYGTVREGMRISLPVILDTIRKTMEQEEQLITDNFDYDELVYDEQMYRYKWITASRIVFCEGAGMRGNPFFRYLPMSDNKGEILLLQAQKYPGLMVKRKYFTIPLESGLIWFGSENSWQDPTPGPSSRAFDALKNELETSYLMPFEIAGHKAAFRPTVKDRRPLLGTHPRYTGMHLFNGLGTKGASLAPYFSKVMAAYLLEGKELPPDVDIRRFGSSLDTSCT